MENKLKLNPKKTKVILFNKSRRYDFPPQLFLSTGGPLEVVSDIKLVGVVLSNDHRWKKNTDYIMPENHKKVVDIEKIKQL